MTTLTQSFTLAPAQLAGPLAVFPVLGPEPRVAYRAFGPATALGAFVKELDGGAAVENLLVGNPTDAPVLLYEGEEVLGAQQNRTFDTSVLVAPGARAVVPVSCVEQGRWDHRRADEHFTVAPQAADPSLRRIKRREANRRAAAGQEARADQGEVWAAVGNRLAEHDVDSASAALDDVYAGRRDAVRGLAEGVHHLPGQVGAVVAVAGRPVALDLVSRPDAFAALLARLAQGYALDALHAPSRAPEPRVAEAFLAAAFAAERRWVPTPGTGHAMTLDGDGLSGSALEVEGELVALSAFSA